MQGDITQGASRVEQKPIEEFQPILQAVLDDAVVVEFGWRQYTPYFNDGEPCEFSVYGSWVRTEADTDVEDEYELDLDGDHPSLGRVEGIWGPDPERPGREKRIGEKFTGPDRARYDRCQALRGAVECGQFEHVLLEAFGDHAAVTVRRHGIEVDFYDHD
ncbi:hypothetical protein J7F03_20610 [Streptomyces sp. ISL-43]|uniref:hypothetical protein n=1 Tax=Streptomyces sp. ISL-43 TaxID=2819183 RepID=UPI001BE7A9E6|nr:hypothetical protein [Streptomyces sp. ISL-43]MBT2449446.1 hypothetical protein [Streptomyces sp. ISL-43]